MLQRFRNVLLRRGLETAVQATADVAASATAQSFRQVFNLSFPCTVYVRASHCAITVTRRRGAAVELDASLQAFFGWEFVTDQDDAGIYIVARRRPVIGALSAVRFALVLPPEANLIVHLTPGSVHLANVDGKLNLPGSAPAIEVRGSLLSSSHH